MRSPRGFREVKTFAAAMLRVLNTPRNAAKGQITNIPLHVSRKKLSEEIGELADAVDMAYSCGDDLEIKLRRLKEVEAESVDVSNCALILHSEARRLRRELGG